MKIMFFANDPGGANAITPLIEPLSKRHEVHVFAQLSALQIMKCKEYNNELKDIMPDVLITGTSARNLNERYLWQEAKKLGIKTVAFVEYWGYYGIRFSDVSVIDEPNFSGECNMLPDYIIVPDDYAKAEAIKERVPEELIYPLGNPHFIDVYNKFQKAEDIRSKFAKKDEFLITYASQPFIEDCGHGEELNILDDILSLTDKKVIVKIHPKESFEKFEKYKNRVILDKTTPMEEVIKASDLVISINSIVLLEALIAGKPIISYQKNEHDKNKFILTRFGYLPFITNKEDFAKELKNKIQNPEILQYNDFIKYDAIEIITNFIEERIWQN